VATNEQDLELSEHERLEKGAPESRKKRNKRKCLLRSTRCWLDKKGILSWGADEGPGRLRGTISKIRKKGEDQTSNKVNRIVVRPDVKTGGRDLATFWENRAMGNGSQKKPKEKGLTSGNPCT